MLRLRRWMNWYAAWADDEFVVNQTWPAARDLVMLLGPCCLAEVLQWRGWPSPMAWPKRLSGGALDTLAMPHPAGGSATLQR